MNIDDAKKARRSKMPSAPIKAPQGNIKGIGKMGQYTGGLSPLVVKPTPGISERRMAPTILRGYGTDAARASRGRGK